MGGGGVQGFRARLDSTAQVEVLAVGQRSKGDGKAMDDGANDEGKTMNDDNKQLLMMVVTMIGPCETIPDDGDKHRFMVERCPLLLVMSVVALRSCRLSQVVVVPGMDLAWPPMRPQAGQAPCHKSAAALPRNTPRPLQL